MEMLTLDGLTKHFGHIVAVDNVSLTVRKGDVLGFLGPNGAGKSTTMKMISGFLEPTAGTAHICGVEVSENPTEAKRLIGYLPEGAPAYEEMDVRSFLGFVAGIRGFSGKDKQINVERAIDRAVLGSVREQRIETLSKGFKRRVGIAQAIVHDPEVLILDEPTDGLDPIQKHHVRALINDMADDKAIVISTHILEEVDAVCTRAAVISQGRVLLDTTADDFSAHAPNHNTTVLTVDTAHSGRLIVTLSALPGVANVEQMTTDSDQVQLRITPKGRESVFSAVTDLAKEMDVTVREVFVERGALDEAFRDVVTKEERKQTTAAQVTDA